MNLTDRVEALSKKLIEEKGNINVYLNRSEKGRVYHWKRKNGVLFVSFLKESNILPGRFWLTFGCLCLVQHSLSGLDCKVSYKWKKLGFHKFDDCNGVEDADERGPIDEKIVLKIMDQGTDLYVTSDDVEWHSCFSGFSLIGQPMFDGIEYLGSVMDVLSVEISNEGSFDLPHRGNLQNHTSRCLM